MGDAIGSTDACSGIPGPEEFTGVMALFCKLIVPAELGESKETWFCIDVTVALDTTVGIGTGVNITGIPGDEAGCKRAVFGNNDCPCVPMATS